MSLTDTVDWNNEGESDGGQAHFMTLELRRDVR